MSELLKTLKVKLVLDAKAKQSLAKTMHAFSQACTYVSKIAYEQRCFNKVALHHLVYFPVREKFKLPAQLACTCRDKVAEAYRASKTRKLHQFSRYTSVRLDARTFAILKDGKASISTVQGRVHVRMILGEWQQWILEGWKVNGAAELVYDKRSDTFYAHIVVRKAVDEPPTSGRIVGVDIGMVNLATSSLGHKFSGRYAQHIRRRHRALRANLLAKGTHGARRCVKRLQGRERRQMAAINHVISRRIVNDLKPGDTMVLEDLTYIRERARQRKAQRADLHSWAFGQLQSFLAYKALERGCRVIHVDPRYSSQLCSRCGSLGQRSGHRFSCAGCGHHAHADFNACYNLVRRALLAPSDGPLSIGPESRIPCRDKLPALAGGS